MNSETRMAISQSRIGFSANNDQFETYSCAMRNLTRIKPDEARHIAKLPELLRKALMRSSARRQSRHGLQFPR
jgi:hypothetical protein